MFKRLSSFMFASLFLTLILLGCSNSDNVLSPAQEDELHTRVLKGDEGVIVTVPPDEQPSMAMAATATVTLQSTGGAIDWRLDLQLQGTNRRRLTGQGILTIVIPDAPLASGKNSLSSPRLNGVILIPIGGGVRVDPLGGGQFSVRLRARSSNGEERVRLRFRGAGTGDPASQTITGTGESKGGFSLPDLRGRLNGPAQIAIDYTGAG